MLGVRIVMEGRQAVSQRLNGWAKNMDRYVNRSVAQEAQLLRRMMVSGIRRQAPGGKKFLPISEATKKRKKSSKALIDKGDLIRSINVQPLFGGQAYFVGVHKNSGMKNGEPIANIAEVHEFGTKDGRIPARPYLRPAFSQWKKGNVARVKVRIMDQMGLGKVVRIAGLKKVLADSNSKAKGFQHEIEGQYKRGKLRWRVA